MERLRTAINNELRYRQDRRFGRFLCQGDVEPKGRLYYDHDEIYRGLIGNLSRTATNLLDDINAYKLGNNHELTRSEICHRLEQLNIDDMYDIAPILLHKLLYRPDYVAVILIYYKENNLLPPLNLCRYCHDQEVHTYISDFFNLKS